MRKITYVVGDATEPIGDGLKIIAHIVNDQGLWGKGFVLAVSNRWPITRKKYMEVAQKRPLAYDGHYLGDVQIVKVSTEITVANMVAQHGIKSSSNPVPLDYSALDTCLTFLSGYAYALGASIHMPRIGCGLGGSVWWKVEPFVVQASLFGVPVFVYDLEGK